MNTAGLLTGTNNRDVIIECKDPSELTQSLICLNRSGLSTWTAAQSVFDVLAKHEEPVLVAEALRILHTVGLLTEATAQTNIARIAEHSNPSRLVYALDRLKTEGLLTDDTAAQRIFDCVYYNFNNRYHVNDDTSLQWLDDYISSKCSHTSVATPVSVSTPPNSSGFFQHIARKIELLHSPLKKLYTSRMKP